MPDCCDHVALFLQIKAGIRPDRSGSPENNNSFAHTLILPVQTDVYPKLPLDLPRHQETQRLVGPDRDCSGVFRHRAQGHVLTESRIGSKWPDGAHFNLYPGRGQITSQTICRGRETALRRHGPGARGKQPESLIASGMTVFLSGFQRAQAPPGRLPALRIRQRQIHLKALVPDS